MRQAGISFVATSKSGLGHLRRLATIAGAVRRLAPDRTLTLLTNAAPDGLDAADLAVFDTVLQADKPRFPDLLSSATAVLDTVTFPRIEQTGGRLILVLRETSDTGLARFRLEGRRWDRVIVANPRDHWLPSFGHAEAEAVVPVGWIYRQTGIRTGRSPAIPRVLVATGGGGTEETARTIYRGIDRVLGLARRRSQRPFRVVQAIGPRARGFGRLAEADEVADPAGQLNAMFRDADAVISTAGYNSVLELASTDTPALLAPIRRSLDDQVARARLWGPRLGGKLDDDAPAAAAWLAAQIDSGARRAPVDLGPSGEDAAARVILGRE